MKKQRLFIFFALIFPLVIASCSSSDDDLVGNWVEVSDFGGVARSGAVCFVIDNVAYVGTGYDGTDRLTDFWKYIYISDSNNYWVRIADFPGEARNLGVAFAVDGKGYVGLGSNDITKSPTGREYFNDFFCYDPATDSWSQIADFGGSARFGAVGFAIGGNGYAGTGYDKNYQMDIYKYNPNTNTWTEAASIPGKKREGASVFTYNDKVYLVGGLNNGENVNDFFYFDYTTESWTALRKIQNVSDESYDDDYNIMRDYGVAFVMGDRAYYTTGRTNGGAVRDDTWEYNFATDWWDEKTGFERYARYQAVGFSIFDRGFVGTGQSVQYRFDNFGEFFPFDEYEKYD